MSGERPIIRLTPSVRPPYTAEEITDIVRWLPRDEAERNLLLHVRGNRHNGADCRLCKSEHAHYDTTRDLQRLRRRVESAMSLLPDAMHAATHDSIPTAVEFVDRAITHLEGPKS